MISSTSTSLVTDAWVKASWENFLALADDAALETGRFYYEQEYMKIEIAALGARHGRQNFILSYVVLVFATLKNIPVVEFANTSFRKTGLREFQPDLALYIGSGLKVPPDSNSPVDLNEYDAPTLVIEVGASLINDDLGRKRLIYERAGVGEYWVDDANTREVIAFSVAEGRSGEIRESLVLPGLRLATVEEALQRSQTEDDGAITRWLLEIFS